MAGETQRRQLERWTKPPRGIIAKANTIVDAVNELRARPSPPRQVFGGLRPGTSSSATSLIPVRLTAYVNAGSTAKNYTGVGLKPAGDGTYTAISPTVNYTGTIFEKRGFVGIELGTGPVFIQSAGTWSGATSSGYPATGATIYEFTFVEPRAFFAVKLYKTSGASGPPSTWVYTAKTPNGDVIATGLTPELRRPSGTATTNPSDGTIGTGYWDTAGTFHLFDSNEAC